MKFEALQSSVNEAENDAPESIPLLENAEAKAMESEAMESEGNKLDRPIVQDVSPHEGEGLSDREKKVLRESQGWYDELCNAISSFEEAEIYIEAGLKEVIINGKSCLIRQDIDLERRDEYGRTNRERMINGQPPLTQSGETIELHHVGQKKDAPLAELTTQEHRGQGNDAILHDKQKVSEIDRAEFQKERESHWQNRAYFWDSQNDSQ